MFDLSPKPTLSLDSVEIITLVLACDPAVVAANTPEGLELYKETSDIEAIVVPEEATTFEVAVIPEGSREHSWAERQAGKAPMYGQLLQAKLFEQLEGLKDDERMMRYAELYDDMEPKQQFAIDKVKERIDRLHKAVVRASLKSISAAPDVVPIDDRAGGGLQLYPSAVIDIFAERYPLAISELAGHIARKSSPDVGKALSDTPSGETDSATTAGDAPSASLTPPSGPREDIAGDPWESELEES